ncbi:MAG: hypothetical protein IPK79_00675 [Vampirovibrionales bacterium]|nr:hypothetical protein [Vampirovibrionales bacterium]
MSTATQIMTTGTGRGKTITALDANDYKGTMQRLYAWIQQQKANEQQKAASEQTKACEDVTVPGRG